MTFIPVVINPRNAYAHLAGVDNTEKQTEIACDIKMKFADLTPEEQRLITSYLKTPIKSPSSLVMKNKIMRNIGTLYSKYSCLPLDPKLRMSITAKLVDYSRIVRGNGITVAEIRASNKNQQIGQIIKSSAIRPVSLNDIKNGPIIITPEELPSEIKNILENLELEKGRSYLKYLKENTNFILFTSQLDAAVTIMTNNDIGTAEELTRTAIVDTFNEDVSSHAKTWFLATTILTEASHIEWYYRHNGDPSLLCYEVNEANAINFTDGFLRKLLASCGTLIDKKEKNDILYVISENSKKLKKLREIK